VTSGSCTGLVCPSGCSVAGVLGWPSMVAGASCDFLVTSTDGRSQSLTLAAVANPSASYTCCGNPSDGRGVWTAVNGLLFSPSSVVVDFASDGGAATWDLGGELSANPCAGCAADEVCTQSFDGMCQLGTVTCRPVSETCRSKLTASGAKSCKSIPECESELCSSPFRCVYDPPCGTEAPEAALYCYGP